MFGFGNEISNIFPYDGLSMDYENVDSIEQTSKSTDRRTFGWTQNFVRLLFFMRLMSVRRVVWHCLL